MTVPLACFALIVPADAPWASFICGCVLGGLLIGGGVAMGLRRRPPASALAPPMPDDRPEAVVVDGAEIPPEADAGGPGSLYMRMKALQDELDATIKEMQRYNGMREAQMQGWQQLNSDIVRRVLPTLENLRPFLDDEDARVADVASMAYGRLSTELVTVGVTPITPRPGEAFDAKYHTVLERALGTPPYRITAVVAPGYLFRPRVPGAGDVVILPAEVKVVGQSAPAPATDAEEVSCMSE